MLNSIEVQFKWKISVPEIKVEARMKTSLFVAKDTDKLLTRIQRKKPTTSIINFIVLAFGKVLISHEVFSYY